MLSLDLASRARCAGRFPDWRLVLAAALGALLLAADPALAQGEEAAPQTLPASRTNPDSGTGSEIEITTTASRDVSVAAPGLVLSYALFVALLGGVIAWCRVLARFQPFWGLGVTRNVYTVSLIVVVGALSGVCYLALASETLTGSGILPDSWDWLPGFDSQAAAQTMTIVGGSALGQAVTVVGRFLRGGRIKTASATQVEELKKVTTSNLFYVLIRESIAARMSRELVVLSRSVDQETIRITVIRLITDQVTIGNVSSEEGEELINRISAMPPSDNERKAEQANYEILHAALRTSGFRQLKTRFAEAAG